MGQIIRITSRRDGFRRAGVAHRKGTVDHPAGAFTAAQLKALQAEPVLTVEIVAAEPEKKPGAQDRPPAGGGPGQQPPAGGTEQPPPPTEAERRATAIRAAVPALDKKKGFTKDGKPEVKAIEKLVGFDTTRDEIDAALAAGGA